MTRFFGFRNFQGPLYPNYIRLHATNYTYVVNELIISVFNRKLVNYFSIKSHYLLNKRVFFIDHIIS